MKKTLHIGIVGCSAEGASLCYSTICIEGAKVLGGHAHPEITIHTPSLERYMEYINVNDWKGVGEIMLESVKKLERSGADFVICPDNTIHQALCFIEEKSPLPWLHIAEVVSDFALEHNYKKVGLTGTKWLVDSDVYPSKLLDKGINFFRPSNEEKEEMNRIIMDELVLGVRSEEGTSFFQNVIHRMKEQNCDAVVLGCTEIPLIINDNNSALPILDSTCLLAKAALKKAIEEYR